MLRIWTAFGDPLRVVDIESEINDLAVFADSIVLIATSKGLAAFDLAQTRL
jgi:hypothetical protein